MKVKEVKEELFNAQRRQSFSSCVFVSHRLLDSWSVIKFYLFVITIREMKKKSFFLCFLANRQMIYKWRWILQRDKAGGLVIFIKILTESRRDPNWNFNGWEWEFEKIFPRNAKWQRFWLCWWWPGCIVYRLHFLKAIPDAHNKSINENQKYSW